jgi:membrane-bound lytic murein transglycosylase B
MNRKINRLHSTIIIFLLIVLWGCASQQEIVKKKPALSKTPSEITVADPVIIPDTVAVAKPDEEIVHQRIKELRNLLAANGVPESWFDEQMQHETFLLHSDINQYFQKSAEKLIDHDKKYDASWYFARLGVDAKIEKGKPFIEKHKDLFERAETKNGIHKELIAAIIGIETNFADRHQRGKFYAFNVLVSQYLFTRRSKFALRELTSLYNFSEKTSRPPQYFTSSYAGAIGWGQFIPSSLLSFFVDSNGRNDDIDPFSIEDTIFSVENYLFKHNLSGRNIDVYDSKYKAVFAYNRSDVYVKAVLYIYDGLRDYSCEIAPEDCPERR